MGPQEEPRKSQSVERAPTMRHPAEAAAVSSPLSAMHAPARPHSVTLEAVAGNLLNQHVDAIVNPWNSNLFRSWWRFLHLKLGLSGTIRKHAGPKPFRELAKLGHIPIGNAVRTSAGNLSCKAIIHVAGMYFVWGATEQSVRKSVRSALQLAERENYQSIAFPLIGTGHGALFP